MRLTKARREHAHEKTASRTARRPSAQGVRLGERLRQLRVAAGLTQSELAGAASPRNTSRRSSAARRADPGHDRMARRPPGSRRRFPRERRCDRRAHPARRALSRAEALYEAQEDEEAAAAFEPLAAAARATGLPELQVRALVGSGLAKMRVGDHRAAVELLNDARAISEAESFSDVERADVLLRLGGCRYQLNSIQTALALFNEALGLAERSGLPCDALKANILSWRSRCWQRQRDFEAARDDVERALELSQGVEDLRTIGAAYFQASLIADREGHWVLARNYAERAREAYARARRPRPRQPADEQPRRPQLPARQHRRGRRSCSRSRSPSRSTSAATPTQVAPSRRSRRFTCAPATSSRPRSRRVRRSTFSMAASTTSTRSGAPSSCSGARCSNRIGSTRRRLRLPPPSRCFGELGSGSHRAAAWVARGDLAARRGDHERAAELYRTAAEALQDVRF